MGMRTGQGKSWTARRVGSLRTVHGIHAYRSAEKNGEWLTMSEVAATLGITNQTPCGCSTSDEGFALSHVGVKKVIAAAEDRHK